MRSAGKYETMSRKGNKRFMAYAMGRLCFIRLGKEAYEQGENMAFLLKIHKKLT